MSNRPSRPVLASVGMPLDKSSASGELLSPQWLTAGRLPGVRPLLKHTFGDESGCGRFREARIDRERPRGPQSSVCRMQPRCCCPVMESVASTLEHLAVRMAV